MALLCDSAEPWAAPHESKEVGMADILEFRRRSSRRPKRDAPPEPATVIIFPGVRIDRNEFSLADRVSAPKPRRSGTRTQYVVAEE